MQDINSRSVRFPETVDQKFEKIALKLGRSKRQVFIQMVDYFYKSKKDPMDLNDEMLKNALIKNHKDLIGFIRTQENDLLIPTRREVDRMIESQRQILGYFNELLKPSLKVMLESQEAQIGSFKITDRLLERLAKNQLSVDQLKKKFQQILDGYAKARENISGFMNNKEKEELLANARAQVENLR